MLPWTEVELLASLTLLHNTTLPPSPLSVALALMEAPLATRTWVAWRKVPLPCQSPPISTVPPPLRPDTSTAAVEVSSISSASNTILPPLALRLVACKLPLFLMTPACSLLSATADKIIWPSGACTASLFSIRLARAEAVVVMPERLLPSAMVRVTVSPAANATVPARANTTPLFCTSGASMAM